MREGKFGSAVLLPNSLRAAAEAWLAGIPQRIGYARGGRSLLLTHAIPAPPRNPARLHQRYYYLDLVTAIGGPSDASLPKLRKEPTDRDRLARAGAGDLSRARSMARPSAGRWKISSRWRSISWRRARRRSILLGAPGDVPIAEEFARHLPEVDNRVGKTSLAEFMAALVSARLVVCNDSGAMHAGLRAGRADAGHLRLDRAATDRARWARAAGSLRHHVPCSPCFLRECPIDFACMKSITPEMAIAAAEALLR